MSDLSDRFRQLAAFPPAARPVLSVYLDMRPEATGETPGRRSGLIVLKDRLREIEKTYLPRGDDLDAFRADATRIEQYLATEYPPAVAGLAIFACAGRDLFAVVESGVAFENQVGAGPVPDLFQLAQLLDTQETAVVAVVDTNTARLFVTRLGALTEQGGSTDDPRLYHKGAMGGWSQARYQRHIDKLRHDFATETAGAIEDLLTREGATRLILAGDEVAITPLQAALSPRAQALALEVVRLDIRTPRDAIHEMVAPLVAAAEAEDARGLVEHLLDAVRAGGFAAVGLDRTMAALERGQVDTLLLMPTASDARRRNRLIRQATMTGAAVEIVEQHDRFAQLGGVGALLRYRSSL